MCALEEEAVSSFSPSIALNLRKKSVLGEIRIKKLVRQ
jgi:hypothetical protein